MSEKELREVLKNIVHQEFKNELDSSRIFAYIQNLEQRIDKAIEYIESKSFSENFEFHSNEWAVRRKLLEILKGEPNNE